MAMKPSIVRLGNLSAIMILSGLNQMNTNLLEGSSLRASSSTSECLVSIAVSGKKKTAMSIVTNPMAAMTQKITRQLVYVTIMPPTTGPKPVPIWAPETMADMADPRCTGWKQSPTI